MENAGILDVFPIFHAARLGQKIRRSPQLPLCGVALIRSISVSGRGARRQLYLVPNVRNALFGGAAALKIRDEPSVRRARFLGEPFQLIEEHPAENGIILFVGDAPVHGGLLSQGIYAAPSQFEAMFLSDAHTDADIQKAITAAKNIF